jgi:hypothetical protein
MSEAKVHASVEQHIMIKFLMKEGCKPSEICSRLKRQYGEKTLSNVSVYKWSSAFKKEGKQWRMKLMSASRELSQHWQPKDFFLSGTRKLPGRWRKCIAYRGDYVEK